MSDPPDAHGCPACGAVNPDGFRFCGSCGAALAVVVCTACGQANPAGQQFCGHCGAAIGPDAAARARPPAPVPRLEERKLATVLFADVVGFTSIAERMDAEAVAHMVDTAFRRMGEVVLEHGGTVDKYMGDSVMAVFGVPVAHDDDAERAVAAGLAMRELGGDLAFSIGINSGEVMATAVGREGDVTVIGDTVNVAARLEKAAGPGEVLCGRLTAELAERRVVFRERQPVVLKGKREPVTVFEAVAIRSRDPGAAPEGPLVGRDEDLAFLVSQWRRTRRDGQAQVVLLCGEAGSGKTRLIDELAVMVGDEARVIRAAYPAYGSMGGPQVAADVIQQLGPSDSSEVNARVRSIVGEMHPSLRAIDPSGMYQEQLWAFRRLLQEKAAEQPVLLVIDDIHRSGDRTLELLGELATRISDIPLLLVLAGRTDPSEWLSRFPAATTVRLAPLSRNDAVALANAFAGDHPLAPEAASFLVGRAAGNPLYMRELVAMARAVGALQLDGDHYRLTAQAAIPATLHAVLAARLDALEPAEKLVLQHVAVFGDAATAEDVAALGSIDPGPALAALVECGLLRHVDDGSYDAVDPLLREVAYETLPRSVRAQLHQRAAGLVAAPEQRARHLDRAAGYAPDDEGLASEAVNALSTAGTALYEASRFSDAIRVLSRAVELGCRTPSVLLALANAEMFAGDSPGAVATLAMVPDDPDDPSIAAERDHTLANAHSFTDPAAAVPGLLEAAERWHKLGDGVKEAWSFANAGVALFNMSRMDEATAQLERGLDLFQKVGDRNGAVATSSFLCLVRPADPRVPGWLEDALAFADETGDRSRQMGVLVTLAWREYFRAFGGGPDAVASAEESARRLAELAADMGVGDTAVHGYGLLSSIARLTGRIDEAVDLAEEAKRWQPRPIPFAAAVAFSAALAKGGADEPPFPPVTSPDPVVLVAGQLVDAELVLAGRVAEALVRFEAAHDLGLSAILEATGVVHALALVLAGRTEEARPLVEGAIRTSAAIDATAPGTAAAALQAELGDAVLPALPESVGGLADALVARAHARQGDRAALALLREAVARLAMPGLLLGLGDAPGRE